MCKVFIMPNINDNNRELSLKLIKKMAELMTPGNNDGLGYAAVNHNGELFAERWLNNKDAFVNIKPDESEVNAVNSMLSFLNTNTKTTTYTSHGVIDLENISAITLHTRMATSSKGMKNTHPFIDKDTSLIHNGVINNDNEFDLKLSTCDSEAILISYLRNQVNFEPSMSSEMAKELTGYYVAATFSRDIDGYRVLDVFKAHNDNLYFVFINTLQTWCLTTNPTNIIDASKQLGLKISEPIQAQDGVLLRINPITGAVISETKFYIGDKYKTQVYSDYGYSYNHKTQSTAPILPMKKKSFTQEEIEYYKNKPKLHKYSTQQVNEYMTNEYKYRGD